MNIDPNTTKYLIKAKITADGVVEKPDVVGAIFGQTEGLLGEELDLRDLQKGGRIGRIEVEISSSKGRSEGIVEIPSSLDQVETAILASALETIDRVGPCKAGVKITGIEDVRVTKRSVIVERAKVLLQEMLSDAKDVSVNLADSVKEGVQIQEIVTYGSDKLPAGPNVDQAEAIIVVEGRNDVLNLLTAGIKNAIAVEGTNVPKTIQELSKQKTVTAFVDGDRGGELVLRELLQVSEVDFIARAPKGKEVEELTNKQIMKALRHKVHAEQFVAMYSLENGNGRSDAPRPPPRPPERSDERPAKDNKKSGGRKLLGRKREEPPEVKEAPKLTDEQTFYKNMFNEVSGKSLARIISEANAVIAEMPVKDLAEALKGQQGTQGIKALVFDGIVTQRLLDIANDMGIGTLAASKIGGVSKYPDGMNVLTKEDFE